MEIISTFDKPQDFKHTTQLIANLKNIFTREKSVLRSCGAYQLFNWECSGLFLNFFECSSYHKSNLIVRHGWIKIVAKCLSRQDLGIKRQTGFCCSLSKRIQRLWFISILQTFSSILKILVVFVSSEHILNSALFCLHFTLSIHHQPSAIRPIT